jgi:predicted alpha/beta superfamily hydrolase
MSRPLWLRRRVECRARAGRPSLGGLFVAYAMTRAPGRFRHYVNGTPAFWAMRDDMEDCRTPAARRAQARGCSRAGVSSGDPETIRSAYFAMVATLQAHAAAELKWSAAFSQGLASIERDGNGRVRPAMVLPARKRAVHQWFVATWYT